MRRRLLRYLAMGLLLLTPLLPVWLLGSSTGLRWMLGQLETRLPVQVQNPAGSLWAGVSFGSLRYSDEAVSIKLENAYLRVNWACALRSIVCIREAEVETLSVDLGSPANDDSPPLTAPLPWLPVSLDIETLSVDELLLSSAGRRSENGDDEESGFAERFTDLKLSGELGRQRALVTQLSGVHRLLDWNGGGFLSIYGAWELVLNLVVDTAEISSWPAGLGDSYSLDLSGNLSSLAGVGRASDNSTVLSVDIDRLPSESVAVVGSLDGLLNLAPQLASYPAIAMSGPLAFELQVTDAQNLDVLFRQQISGFADAPQWLSVDLQQVAEVWELREGVLGNAAQPLLHVSGPLGSLTSLTPELQLVVDHLAVPLELGQPETLVSGAVELTFAVADFLGSYSLATEGLDVEQGDVQWSLEGNVRASEVPMLPTGELAGSREALAFSYRRSDLVGAPAILELPEGLPGGELTVSALKARITPGDTTELDLRAEGDLRGDLNLLMEKTAAGVDFRLEPFVVYLRDEAIHSKELVQGNWNADAAAINLEAFCLQWRINTACADGASLGQSGMLGLAVQINEELQGAVSQKPFSLQAKGAGTVTVAWLDGELEDAAFDVDFDVLSIDPYLHEGTANPIQWEHARAAGEIKGNNKSLTMNLRSSRVGGLYFDVNESGESLAGALKTDGLDLAALDDLLPEWTLRSGNIEADLTVEGSRESPQVFGQVVLDDAAARHPDIDTVLSEVRLNINAVGEGFTVDAQGKLGGAPLSLTGVCCDEDALVADLEGARNAFRLASMGVEATVSPDLSLLLTRDSVTIDGQVTVHKGVLEHSGPADEAVALSSDFHRLDLPQSPPRRFDVVLDLRALIEPGFTLRSKEIEATLAGDLSVNLQPDTPPSLYGDLQVLGGELRAYGQVLRLTEGSVGFVGDPVNPALNLSAERRIRAEDLRVGFHVRGSLEEPVFEIFSDPVRSERDTLSYLLRGRGPDAGASVDGTAMALSLGASAINQSGALESLNSIPGLSGVALGAEGSDDDMAATISAYVGERLYLSYGVGIYEPVNALTARLYLRSRLWLEVVSRLESSFDLYYRFDID
ncbi:translocation/assembly module TamB domain-containing protein [Congregibacter brevis]|uniref:Translocation/assembly module TamB domain-containing protein n=1 Tax=Congregibacter brevis TaxID=3081201 RepID=A0ABZ0I9E9_9GAMM|nr:translocation/assembly module TamB domain-containing protein [Congregibacter sp. IMCC45268]